MARYSQETVQKILDATDIVDLIQGYFPLKRSGSAFLALCPFHNENTPSFNVNPHRQTFHCFGCHAGGDVIRFTMLYENLSFAEAAKRLAERAGLILEEEEFDPEEDARRRVRSGQLRLQKAAADWFHHLLFKSPLAQPARDYLTSRGLSMEASRQWKLGYAPPQSRMLFNWAKREGFTNRQVVEVGLAKWSDEQNPGSGAYSFFRHRLMFPVNNDRGETLGFSGRILSPDQSGGKYVNSPETALFTKSKILFGFDQSKRAILRQKHAILFEGQLDVISAFSAGIENLVAPLGTAFTADHAQLLKRYTEEVILCFDADTAGIEAARKAFRILAPKGILIRLAMLPNGEDPDSLIRKKGAQELRNLLDTAAEFFDFQIDREGGQLGRKDLRERLAFAKGLAADIALIKEKMLQDSLINRIAIRLGVGEDEIRKYVVEAVHAQRRAELIAQRRANTPPANRTNGTSDATGDPGNAPQGESISPPRQIKNRSVRLLCRGLLTDPEVKRWSVAEPHPEFVRNLPETEALSWLWEENFDPSTASSINALFLRMPDHVQCVLRPLFAEDGEIITLELAQDCLSALYRQSLQREIEAIKTQMGDPTISREEATRLTKVLLDLRKQLTES